MHDLQIKGEVKIGPIENRRTSKKLEILEIKLRQFLGFSAKFVAENQEFFKFALCLERALLILAVDMLFCSKIHYILIINAL